jgi:hypothetical protein
MPSFRESVALGPSAETPDSLLPTSFDESAEDGLFSGLAERLSALSAVEGLEALRVLCRGYAANRMPVFGRMLASGLLTECVTKLGRLSDYLVRFPEISAVAIPEPLFIVAPFRTGTTFLHRLLALDASFRWTRPWETSYAPPEAAGDPRSADRTDDRIARLERALGTLRRKSPDLFRLHAVAPNEAEECFGLLETSLLSPSFVFHGAPRGYLDWLAERPRDSWIATYRRYADQLRLLQWWSPGERWLLKSPLHLHGLGALLEVFPGAKIIQIHRDPAACQLSLCRLLAAHHALYTSRVKLEEVGALGGALMRGGLARAVEARRGGRSATFLDLSFDALVGSPISCVRRVYDWLGSPLTHGTELRMRSWLAKHPSSASGGGALDLADFGLDPRAIERDYAPYTAMLEKA